MIHTEKSRQKIGYDGGYVGGQYHHRGGVRGRYPGHKTSLKPPIVIRSPQTDGFPISITTISTDRANRFNKIYEGLPRGNRELRKLCLDKYKKYKSSIDELGTIVNYYILAFDGDEKRVARPSNHLKYLTAALKAIEETKGKRKFDYHDRFLVASALEHLERHLKALEEELASLN